MLTKKQLKVIDVFRKNLGKKLTAKQIKESAKINSNKFLYRALSNCMHEEIMTTEQVGKSLLYRLEINNRSASYLGLVTYEIYDLPNPLLNTIEQEVGKKISSFIGIVFGSYAKGTQRKDSDLDIAILVENKKEVSTAKAVMESIKLRELLPVHYQVFSNDEFTKMLKHELENVGKEIARNQLIFYNPASFYSLIKPWIR
ncbi:MAG: nucleotidyltransferase domain-containing protein [Nanoarchaeota archaeon]